MTRMRAAVCTRFGPPEVLEIREVPAPSIGRGDVLVRVRAADVSMSDCYGRSGFAGAPVWMRTIVRIGMRVVVRHRVVGLVLAGDVERLGSRVTDFNVGDRVFAFTGMRGGGHAELARVSASGFIARIPDRLSYVDAAAIPYGGLIASACLARADIRQGSSILIYGASGAIGSAAVQLAVAKGAIVTGVSSAANRALVRSLGAHDALAYDADDLPSSGGYDFMFDAAGLRKTSALKAACERATRSEAISVDKLGLKLQRNDLRTLAALVESGRLKPTIDGVYPLEQIVDAHRRVETRHKRGSVIIQIQD